MPVVLPLSRRKPCEQRTYPARCFHPLARSLLTCYQVWGVTEQYFKEHVFPDASDSVLSTLGSMSGIVSVVFLASFTPDAAPVVYDIVERHSRQARRPLVSEPAFITTEHSC